MAEIVCFGKFHRYDIHGGRNLVRAVGALPAVGN